ncbi:S9 family peptidase [Psychrobium sp. nBUS_13]|uniref:S9 family peptidase n=1 Tax=Psychrobium sp. nBUS_13 TaxID=3395319 RepID=UPI003EBB5B95
MTQPIAPIAKKIPHQLTTHNETRIDNYYWMRDDSRSDKEILAHLTAENDYCDAMLAPQKTLQDSLFEELKSRICKDDNSVPVKDGDYWYHSEVSGDEEYSRYYRASDNKGTNKQLLLDVNVLAASHEHFELGDMSISPDDSILSYASDLDGRRIYTINFKQIESSTLINDVLENTEGQIVWANNNKTVFYVKKDPQTLLGTQVYRHVLGTNQSDDELVYEEEDHSFYMSLDKSRDESLIFINLESTETSDIWFIDANTPMDEFAQLIDCIDEHEYSVDKLGDTFYIVSNHQATNFKVMTATTETIFDVEQWATKIEHRDDVLIEDIEIFNDYLIIVERELGQIRFVIHRGDTSYPMTFDDPCYYACLGDNPEPSSTTARIYYSSLTTPGSLFETDLATTDRTLLKAQKVLGEFNSDDYESQRIFVTSRDNQQVPVSLVYKKSLYRQDGTNPVLQYGYGAYGITIDPNFSPHTLSLLNRGFVYAIAHVRGSEMLGRRWYEDGKKAHKQNTFNDFIDVSKHLLAEKIAHPQKLFASGGSAGGLLMGAIINQAPQLYRGVGAHVPFVDVVTTMLDESIPLTTNEYDEWGNPNELAAYNTIKAYSPIDNVTAQHYPNLLVTTGLHDSQVQYFEPMKWVAKLRECKTNDNLLVFKTDMESGHAGASGRFKSLEEKALEMAFFINLCD